MIHAMLLKKVEYLCVSAHRYKEGNVTSLGEMVDYNV